MNKMNKAAKAEKAFKKTNIEKDLAGWTGRTFKSQSEANPAIPQLKIISCRTSVKQIRNEKAEITNPNVVQGYRLEVEIPNTKKALDDLRHWLYQNLKFD